MDTITWGHPCFVCHRHITRGRPTLVFSTDHPEYVGIRHSKCADKPNLNHYDGFQTHPPNYLSQEQVSFLMHFYPRLFSLPGGLERNRELRWCTAELLYNYPNSMINPMVTYRKFLDEHKRWHHEWLYDGDLETGFLRFLGSVQKAAKENPSGAEADFRVK